MKISVALLFFVLVTVTQLCTSNVLPKDDEELLLTVKNANGIQNGNDVIMVKPGPLDIVLTKNDLVFEICSKKCFADFVVCFEGDPLGQNGIDKKYCDTKCGFYVTGDSNITGDKNWIKFVAPNLPTFYKNETCDIIKMEYDTIKIRRGNFPGCSPKIENGNVKLNIINVTAGCPVSIKNAKIRQNEALTLDDYDDFSAANIYGNFGWIFVLTLFCILQY